MRATIPPRTAARNAFGELLEAPGREGEGGEDVGRGQRGAQRDRGPDAARKAGAGARPG